MHEDSMKTSFHRDTKTLFLTLQTKGEPLNTGTKLKLRKFKFFRSDSWEIHEYGISDLSFFLPFRSSKESLSSEGKNKTLEQTYLVVGLRPVGTTKGDDNK